MFFSRAFQAASFLKFNQLLHYNLHILSQSSHTHCETNSTRAYLHRCPVVSLPAGCWFLWDRQCCQGAGTWQHQAPRHTLNKEQPALVSGHLVPGNYLPTGFNDLKGLLQPKMSLQFYDWPHLACKASIRATTPGSGTSPVEFADQQQVIFPRREDQKIELLFVHLDKELAPVPPWLSRSRYKYLRLTLEKKRGQLEEAGEMHIWGVTGEAKARGLGLIWEQRKKHAGLAHARDQKAVTVFLTRLPASPGPSKHCRNI